MIATLQDMYNNFIKYVIDKKNIILFTSRDCNFRCQHCVQGQQGHTDKQLMPKETIARVIDQLDSSYFVCLCGGECMLHIDQVEYAINLCHKKNIKTMIGTNCFWWNNEKILQQVKEMSPTILRLSVDTFHQEFVSLENVLKLAHWYDDTNILVYGGSILGFECSNKDRQQFDTSGLLYEVMSCVYSGNATLIDQRERLRPNRLLICEACGVVIVPSGDLFCECELEAGGCQIGHIDNSSIPDLVSKLQSYQKPWYFSKETDNVHDIYELCQENGWHVLDNWTHNPMSLELMKYKPMSNFYGKTVSEIRKYFADHFVNIPLWI